MVMALGSVEVIKPLKGSTKLLGNMGGVLNAEGVQVSVASTEVAMDDIPLLSANCD